MEINLSFCGSVFYDQEVFPHSVGRALAQRTVVVAELLFMPLVVDEEESFFNPLFLVFLLQGCQRIEEEEEEEEATVRNPVT